MQKFLLLFAASVAWITGGIFFYVFVLAVVAVVSAQLGPFHGIGALIIMAALAISAVICWGERNQK